MPTNKVALITGAAGSIGSATAIALARTGAAVFINDISETAGHALVERIADEGGIAHFIQGDATREEDIVRVVQAAVSRFERVDILVNCAGYNVDTAFRKSIYDYDEDKWNKVVDICLDSVYYCCRHVMPLMVKNGGGSVVNIGSVAGFYAPLRLQSPYSAAKAAIVNLTRSMAVEYAKHHIRVNAVVPGSIMNEQLKKIIYATQEKTQSMLEHIPMATAGEPEDIAEAIRYLASDEAKHVTGCIIPVDGGWTAGYALPISG